MFCIIKPFFSFYLGGLIDRSLSSVTPSQMFDMQPEQVAFMDKMFGWMLPRGANKLPLSNMHMGGLGTWMMKDRMAGKNLPNLPGLMEEARKSGIRLVACTMSMEAMGIREEELIDGVELGGVAEYLGAASETNANLFI